MTKSITLVIFIGIVLFIIYINKPSGSDQRDNINRDRVKILKDSINMVVKFYQDSLHKRELYYLESFSKVQKSSDKWEGQARYFERKLNEERNNHRSFSDAVTDSLLSEIR